MSSDQARSHGRAPLGLVIPAVITLAFLTLPIIAVVVRAPWTSVVDDLRSGDAATALRLSLQTTTCSALLCVVFGIPLAWLLARSDFTGKSAVRALVTLPLVLPPVVGGIALLLALGRNGLVGGPLHDWFGVSLPFTTVAVVIAQTFVALPFMVISVEGTFRATDRRFDDAAATLGATRWQTFRRVTLPLAGPGVLSGTVLSWARALGEFGATVTFAGSFPGTTRTMPTAVYLGLQSGNPDVAIALSLVLIAVSIAILALLRDNWLSKVAP